MRATTWKYLGGDAAGTQLIAIAREIALGNAFPPPLAHPNYATIPSAINYLTNGETPEIAPHGLSSLLPGGFELKEFTGLNFPLLEPLADAKTVGVLSRPVSPFRLCGFQTGGQAGLSILFGGWSDFCLWCWAKHPAGPSIMPTVILSPDNGPLVARPPSTCRPVKAGVDWGVAEACDVRSYWQQDLSTQRLFHEIAAKAYGSHATVLAAEAANPGYLAKFEEYVGTKRIFVFNVWPWFRIDNLSTGSNIHSFGRLSKVKEVVKELVDVLAPCNVITLGNWAVNALCAPNPVHVRWLAGACVSVGVPHPCYHPSCGQWVTHSQGAKGFFGQLP